MTPAAARNSTNPKPVDQSVFDIALELLERYDAALDTPIVYWREGGHAWRTNAGELRRAYREFKSVL